MTEYNNLQELKDDLTNLRISIKNFCETLNESSGSNEIEALVGSPTNSLSSEHQTIITAITELDSVISSTDFVAINTALDNTLTSLNTANSNLSTMNITNSNISLKTTTAKEKIDRIARLLEKYASYPFNNELSFEFREEMECTTEAYQNFNIDETIFSSQESFVIKVNDEINTTPANISLATFRAKPNTTGSIDMTIYVGVLKSIPNYSLSAKIYFNGTIARSFDLTEEYTTFTLNNLTFNEGNSIRLELTGASSIYYVYINYVELSIHGENVLRTSIPKTMHVDRYGDDYMIRLFDNAISFVHMDSIFDFRNPDMTNMMYDFKSQDGAFTYSNNSNNQTFPAYYALSSSYKLYYYDIEDFTLFRTMNLLSLMNCDSGPGDNRSSKGKLVGAGTYNGRHFHTCFSNDTLSMNYYGGFLNGNCANVTIVKETHERNENCVARLVGTDLSGKNYFLNGSSSSNHQLYLGFGTNVTAFYTDTSGTKVSVFMKELNKIVRYDIDCSQTTAVLLGKMTINTEYDEIHLTERGYYYVKNHIIGNSNRKTIDLIDKLEI